MCDVDSIGSKPAGGAEKENRLLSEVESMCDVDSIGSKPAGGAEKESRLLASESARPEPPPGLDEHEVSLADLFHDSIISAQNRLIRSWSDWVHIAEVVHEMPKLVTQSHTSIWNELSRSYLTPSEWTLEEQVEASSAFADAWQSLGVVSIKEPTKKAKETYVCFAIEPI